MIRAVLHYLHRRLIHAMLKTPSQGLCVPPERRRVLCILGKQIQKAHKSTSGTLCLRYLYSQLNCVTSWCHAAPRWQRWRSLNIRPLYSLRELLGLYSLWFTPMQRHVMMQCNVMWSPARSGSSVRCKNKFLHHHVVSDISIGDHMILWINKSNVIHVQFVVVMTVKT